MNKNLPDIRRARFSRHIGYPILGTIATVAVLSVAVAHNHGILPNHYSMGHHAKASTHEHDTSEHHTKASTRELDTTEHRAKVSTHEHDTSELHAKASTQKKYDSQPQVKGSSAGSVWGDNYFPNTELTTHNGKKVRFFDDLIAGKVVAINFIYTNCNDVCPLETARMKDVHRLLEDRAGKDVHFYSITVDPEYDTPQVLKAYSEQYRTPEDWLFLTGTLSQVNEIQEKFGMYIQEKDADGDIDHDLSLVIGNQVTGRWMKRSPFENPYVLAVQLGGELHNWKLPREARGYAKAPELRDVSHGESLFRTRCEACHSIGGSDMMQVASSDKVGPDLHNVSVRRDRQWLRRWIAEPDVMLREKDPLAMELFAAYNEIPMPNLDLSSNDVEALLGYIDRESRRTTLLTGSHHANH